jgi:hypothetical protein
VNGLAAAALAAGELICEFSDGYRKSLLADGSLRRQPPGAATGTCEPWRVDR